MEGDQAEEETKICSNCKRDIPRVNFLVHSVHCARNIRTCATCKEPVPLSELQDHHDRLHKLQPCKACGESVCGSDLEDHVRDSCANTVRPCRFCELELPRKKLPQHENYCGSRTEQCEECQEWVQIKYRQLHLDSNHGFIKLDDEPAPIPQLPRPNSTHIRPVTSLANWSNITQPIRTTVTRPATATTQPTANGSPYSGVVNATKQTNLQRTNEKFLKPVPNTSTSNEIQCSSNTSSYESSVGNSNDQQRSGDHINGERSRYPTGSNSTVSNDVSSHGRNGLGARPKRTNDRPQVNTSVAGANKISKDSSHGVIKKRPAPKPPTPSPQRDNALRCALARSQEEEAARREQNAINASMGLPPVLSAAEKLEKLRKMDALHNRETQEPDYSNRLRGQCWRTNELVSPGQVLGHGEGTNPRFLLGNPSGELRILDSPEQSPVQVQVNRVSADHARSANDDPRRPKYPCERRNDLKDLKPMSQAQFLDRFQEIHNGRSGAESDRRGGEGERRGAEGAGRREDRFSEIKFSLRELRRGLNEVTAPYNTSGNANNNGGSSNPPRVPSPAARARSASPPLEEDVQLPCEFCGVLVPPEDLVLHQTGCRPDLVAYSPRPSPGRSPSPGLRCSPRRPSPRQPSPRQPSPTPHDHQPVIPCEFCAESLPVYLINEHQERCRRENDQLYLD